MNWVRNRLRSRRVVLTAVLLAVSVGVTVFAVSAAENSLSYYVTPEEFAQQVDAAGSRWRVGGRVVEGSVSEERGRPTRWEIQGEHGERMTILYPEGPVPNLFGAGAFVIAEGKSTGPGQLLASTVILKHEDEFLKEGQATPGGCGVR